MKIAFWNVYKNQKIDPFLKSFVFEYGIDVLILAEYDGNINSFCQDVNSFSSNFTTLNCLGCDKICGIANKKYHQELLFAHTRYSILKLETSYFQLLLCMIHAESNLNASDYDRNTFFYLFRNDILSCEDKSKTNNTIIIGDLNSNPFDSSVIGISSLHGIPFKEEAKKETRVFQGKNYGMFYNPMWRFLTAPSPPYGTYYLNNSRPINYFWNVFDQVLIRPVLLPAFDEDSLQIVQTINNQSLLKNGYAPNKEISDHLPILFVIQEEHIK